MIQYQKSWSLVPGHRRLAVFVGAIDETRVVEVGTLPVCDQRRMANISDPRSRNAFCSVRHLLRNALGQFAGTGYYAGAILIAPGGKPFLPRPYSGIEFNLSHSRSVVAISVSEGLALGVDIEPLRRSVSRPLIDRVFNAAEIAVLSRTGFDPGVALHGWIRKEAVLKCIGAGFARDPKSICVPIGSDGGETALDLAAPQDCPSVYRCIEFPLQHQMIGVVAMPAVIAGRSCLSASSLC